MSWNELRAKLTAVSWLNVGALTFLAVSAACFVWTFVNRDFERSASAHGEVSAAGTVAAALTNANAPTTSYLTNASMDALTRRLLAGQMG